MDKGSESRSGYSVRSEQAKEQFKHVETVEGLIAEFEKAFELGPSAVEAIFECYSLRQFTPVVQNNFLGAIMEDDQKILKTLCQKGEACKKKAFESIGATISSYPKDFFQEMCFLALTQEGRELLSVIVKYTQNILLLKEIPKIKIKPLLNHLLNTLSGHKIITSLFDKYPELIKPFFFALAITEEGHKTFLNLLTLLHYLRITITPEVLYNPVEILDKQSTSLFQLLSQSATGQRALLLLPNFTQGLTESVLYENIRFFQIPGTLYTFCPDAYTQTAYFAKIANAAEVGDEAKQILSSPEGKRLTAELLRLNPRLETGVAAVATLKHPSLFSSAFSYLKQFPEGQQILRTSFALQPSLAAGHPEAAAFLAQEKAPDEPKPAISAAAQPSPSLPTVEELKEYYRNQKESSFFRSVDIFGFFKDASLSEAIGTLKQRAAENPDGTSAKTLEHFHLQDYS